MARVTIEDCLKNVDNRFDLVIKAAKRAHLLELGAADAQVPLDNDKPTVVALREIAAGCDITRTHANTVEEIVESEVSIETEETEDLKADGDGFGVIEETTIIVEEAIVTTEETTPTGKTEDK